MQNQRRSGGIFESALLVLAGFAVALVAFGWWVNWFNPSNGYRARYVDKVSQNSEEWLIRDFFQDRRGGTFVDVGAADYKEFSNTHFLETSLGWSGLAIDAPADYGPAYAKHRPRTRFFALFVSDRDDAKVELFVPTHGTRGVASSDGTYVAQTGHTAAAVTVPTITLSTLLQRTGLERIDFLSMDIERAEPLALAGFDIKRFRPSLVCIEAHLAVRQALLDYFADHGYVLVSRYLDLDSNFNLYFMPRNQPVGGVAGRAAAPWGGQADRIAPRPASK